MKIKIEKKFECIRKCMSSSCISIALINGWAKICVSQVVRTYVCRFHLDRAHRCSSSQGGFHFRSRLVSNASLERTMHSRSSLLIRRVPRKVVRGSETCSCGHVSLVRQQGRKSLFASRQVHGEPMYRFLLSPRIEASKREKPKTFIFTDRIQRVKRNASK